MTAVGFSYPADLFAVVDDAATSRARRVYHYLENDGEKGARVMRRGEGVADEGQSLAGVTL